ncbi:MAG: tRNA 2-thiocytidine(32) synthetase TtcA [Eubacteriaceae bacterium]|nr:tRNA 2-thiocytidine(32) synthetase TtcA [Eubacteriaceae bacterium]
MKQILSKLRRACDDYNMISPNDNITVGVSGGKDSMTLLTAMDLFRRFSPIPFDITGVCLDLGFNADYKPMIDYCRERGIRLEIIPTNIGKIVFESRKESNPCALCSKMKRGALNNAALELGSRKVALGHHGDDLMETFFLELFYNGAVKTFKPVTRLDKKGITVIRPLIYLRESEIIYAANKEGIPKIESLCPADGATKREDMKTLIKKLSREIPDSDESILTALKKYIKEDN